MSEQPTVTVRDNTSESRFEVCDDSGVVAGFSEYRLRGDVIVFLHTEVDDAFEGQGIGTALVRSALNSARERGLKVRLVCPFFKAFVEEHEEYQDLLVST